MAPESIVDHRARAALEFCWGDGERYVATYRMLRASCPCADCKALRAVGGDGDAGDDVQLADIQPVGAYGVQFVFSDGHDRGIFPWGFLRDLLAGRVLSAVTR
ncbi:gamma-butyrobetaine hydroxylase-like domain-containing protein [Variovorax boronicumulans]|uniref:gamma-butyrobetaine hydroxylase-like domain-containing protein n=1 Tax=Variovorax boronicumulans TaxID=436515 RepID=UPI0027D90777|nr:gamma-butyrobetaine hydroxylase-like domain-containing protein [Variovorax boronicumulans]